MPSLSTSSEFEQSIKHKDDITKIYVVTVVARTLSLMTGFPNTLSDQTGLELFASLLGFFFASFVFDGIL